MQKNFQDFSMQEVLRKANTPAGQKLIAMLQQADPASIDLAMQQINCGNYEQALAALQSVLSTEEGKQLIERIRS